MSGENEIIEHFIEIKKTSHTFFYGFLYMNSHKNTYYIHLISHTIY